MREAQGVINQLELIDKNYKRRASHDEIEATDECLSYKNVSAVNTGGLTMKTCTNNQDHVPPIKLLFYLFPMFLVINMMLLPVGSVCEYPVGFIAFHGKDYPVSFMFRSRGENSVYYDSYLHDLKCYTNQIRFDSVTRSTLLIRQPSKNSRR